MSREKENSTLEEFLGKAKKGFAQAGSFMLIMLALTGGFSLVAQDQALHLFQPGQEAMERFDTCSGIADAFSRPGHEQLYWERGISDSLAFPMAAEGQAIASGAKAGDYSGTNVQVEGVDEADIVKTDGEYIYTVSGSNLVIIRAYPADQAEIVSETDLGEFSPEEMLIKDDMIMLFGYVREVEHPVTGGDPGEAPRDMHYPYRYYRSFMRVQLWDVSDREDPENVREADFDGSYVTSRMIDDDVYFVINSYPRAYPLPADGRGVIPEYRDSITGDGLVPVCGCTDVGYFEPGYAQSFIILASMSMSDPDAGIEREVVVGSGQNIYASQGNIYIAEHNRNWLWPMPLMEAASTDAVQEPGESTKVHKFSLEGGRASYAGSAEVPGRVLNQFSMDEHDGYFRIATTSGSVTRLGSTTTNDLYVYDRDMNLAGSLEGLAPGESIYSVRFMGERAYMVTFVKIDPLFVIDLSDPENPEVLGKLKIPGYSDYLHPYDENHIIGVGKETEPAGEDMGDFSWHQGVKMALFDVSDVRNPVEIHKVVIGDRGTDSYALHDHRAFLFDREKNLLVLPILLAKIGNPGNLPAWSYGDYVYQGAYVYSINPDEGFELKGRVTHYEDDDIFRKSGHYFYGDSRSVKRAGYLDDTLWTLSGNMLKLNDLGSLEELASVEFSASEKKPVHYGTEGHLLSASSDSPGVHAAVGDA